VKRDQNDEGRSWRAKNQNIYDGHHSIITAEKKKREIPEGEAVTLHVSTGGLRT